MFDAVDAELRDGLMERLQSLGIRSLADAGNPSDQTRTGPTASHFRPAVPAKHLQSRYQRFAGEHAYHSMLRDTIPATQIRLRSSAGPTAGTAFTAPLHLSTTPFHGRQIYYRTPFPTRVSVATRPLFALECNNPSRMRRPAYG